MRLRWIVFPVALVLSVIGVYAVCHQAGGAVDTIVGMARRVAFGALMGVGFWAASHVLQYWMGHASRPLTSAPASPSSGKALQTGEGKYRVRGKDKETDFEITEIVYADSPGNAQLKVELKGVQVAAVERAG
jgi:hypothetical protein